jgi:hypothetical protein
MAALFPRWLPNDRERLKSLKVANNVAMVAIYTTGDMNNY